MPLTGLAPLDSSWQPARFFVINDRRLQANRVDHRSFAGFSLHNLGSGQQVAAGARRRGRRSAHRSAVKFSCSGGATMWLGDRHPDTLISINNMATLLEDMGKLEEARPLYEEALQARRETLGDRHPDTLASIYNLGLTAGEAGQDRRGHPSLHGGARGARVAPRHGARGDARFGQAPGQAATQRRPAR